ncbi:MAG: GNAT family N-acetyltransferase [Cellvibrio sp.]|uniref:GNAT family N-acetyltransferase n=1 Tax=Cellvibrio sp. TaxID=1965322 RepID=UPI00319F75E5
MIFEVEINLEPVDAANKSIIDNLWQFYEFESSFWSKEDVDTYGRYGSLADFLARVGTADTFDWGYIIKYQNQLVGFLIVADEYIGGKSIREFADIYILPKYRGLGIATQLIRTTILNSDHPWLICVFREDTNALNFWRNTFARLPFNSVRENLPPEIATLHEFIIND